MSELKSCPFCGSIPHMMACNGSGQYMAGIGTVSIGGIKTDHVLIVCNCGIRTKPYLTKRGAFNMWNRRAPHKEDEE